MQRMGFRTLKILGFDVLPSVGPAVEVRPRLLDFLFSTEERIQSIFPSNLVGRMLILVVEKS